jgi:hypothetical protein
MTARGRRGVAGVQAARGIVRETHTRRVPGLGSGVRPKGAGLPRRSCTAAWRHADAAGRGHTRRRARGRSGSKQLRVSYFELNFLNFSKQNCTKV